MTTRKTKSLAWVKLARDIENHFRCDGARKADIERNRSTEEGGQRAAPDVKSKGHPTQLKSKVEVR